jgi:hypothetical protein
MPVQSRDFLVDTSDLRQARIEDTALPALADGQALLRIDRFALTANNITYAVFGEAMAYWQFFPGPTGWGRIPVWGFAEVIESKLESIRPRERVYGYLPMSTHLIVQPVKVNDAIFMDGSAHRAPLPAAYQLYRRVPAGGDTLEEDQRALLHPLFLTSFLIDDFLADNALFGANQVLLASASSKTALGLGHLLRARGVRVIGLTSARNVAFCERVGYYDQVLPYDELARLLVQPSVFVDMAGDGKLLHAVHHHFRDELKHSCMVGATHWEQRGAQHALPGAKPQFFFAPDRIRKRSQDWGAGGIDQRFAAAWGPFRASVGAWLKVRHGRGSEAVERVYREVLEGTSGPETGHILSPA